MKEATARLGIQKGLLGTDLATFCRRASRFRWQQYRHLTLLCQTLEAVVKIPGQNLMVAMPPRHGKSYTLSQFFPAWYLLNNPEKRIILASYSDSLASSFSRRIREIVSEVGPWLDLGLSHDNNKQNEWEIEGYHGGVVSAGVGTGITGRGADLLVVDDPLKDAKEAQSNATKDGLWDWWESTATTRVEPGGNKVVVETRWADDDLVGRIEASPDADKWWILSLPALAEEDDPLGREVGEALCPERYDRDTLEDLRAIRDPFWFSALYQQQPTPREGGMFQRTWFKYFKVIDIDGQRIYDLDLGTGHVQYFGSECAHFAIADCAMTPGAGDWSVIGHFARTPGGHLLLIDMWRDRVAGTDLVPIMQHLKGKWNFPWIGIEANGTQKIIHQLAVQAGLAAQKLLPVGSKEDRAIPVGMRMRDGFVFFNQNKPFVPQLEDELLHFGVGVGHDDQVDVLAYAENQSNGSRPNVRVI